MTWGLTAVAGATLVGGYMSSRAQSQAGQAAADAQVAASDKSVDELHRQFDAVQQLLKPYITAGGQGLTGQLDLLGLNGDEAYKSAIDRIQQSPEMAAATKEGEAGILANASATGNLRGGNTEGALAQFRPQMLSQMIQQRLAGFGQIAQLGQASAAGQASAGLQTGQQVAGAYGQAGAALAGGALADGRATAGMWNNIGQSVSTLGMLKLLKGF